MVNTFYVIIVFFFLLLAIFLKISRNKELKKCSQ